MNLVSSFSGDLQCLRCHPGCVCWQCTCQAPSIVEVLHFPARMEPQSSSTEAVNKAMRVAGGRGGCGGGRAAPARQLPVLPGAQPQADGAVLCARLLRAPAWLRAAAAHPARPGVLQGFWGYGGLIEQGFTGVCPSLCRGPPDNFALGTRMFCRFPGSFLALSLCTPDKHCRECCS